MQYNTPLISIVTVCYNSEVTIERTILSVLSQEFKDYEYIIIDGASTDSTIDIIERFRPSFGGRLKFLSEPDRGIYDAFTKGCKLATGRYVWIVNSDDFIESDALLTIQKALCEYVDISPIISFGMNFRSSDGKRIIGVQRTNASNCKRNYINDSMGILHPATIIPKSVYEEVGYYCPEFRIIGDIDWFHRAYSRKDIVFVFKDDVITNMCDGGISNVFNFKKSSADRKLFLRRKYKNPLKRLISYLKWVKFFYTHKRNHNRSFA